jgi:hypothetical protein
MIFRQCRNECKEFCAVQRESSNRVRETINSTEHLELSKIPLFYPQFVAEMLDPLYGMYNKFRIDTPSKLPVFLNADFFGAKRTPRDAKLCALRISGSLDEGYYDSIDVNTLASDFKALSDCSWAPNFQLSINFRTEVGVYIFNTKSIPRVARRIHIIWQILHPWIIEAEKRGAKVRFTIYTKVPGSSNHYANGQFERREWRDGKHEIFNSEAEWVHELTETLGPECQWLRRNRTGYTNRMRVLQASRPKAYAAVHAIGASFAILYCVCFYIPGELLDRLRGRSR